MGWRLLLLLGLAISTAQECFVTSNNFTDQCSDGETCTPVGCRCLAEAQKCLHSTATYCAQANSCPLADGSVQCCRSGESCIPDVGCRCAEDACAPFVCEGSCLLPDPDNLMPMTMKLKNENRLQCFMTGYCDSLRTPSHVGAKVQCVDGFVSYNGINYPCQNVDLLSFLSFEDLGCTGVSPNAQGNDVWGWSKDGRDFAIMGCTTGTSFVEITDPENPRTIGFINSTDRVVSTWRDMKVFADTAYIVSEARGHGLQYFNLNRLLTETRPGPSNVMLPDGTYTNGMGYGSTHNLHCNEDTGFCYLVGCRTCAGGLLMVNVQEPLNPQPAGCFDADGYTHDTQCVLYHGPDHRFQNKEICFASNEDSLTIVDVTNKTNPVMLARKPYYGVSYCHQAWLSESQQFLFMDDELDEMYNTYDTTKRTVTYVWDVSDLTEPIQFTQFQSPVMSIDHNQYVRGNYVYQANYASGLRVWRGILNTQNTPGWQPELIGYFDVHPDSDVAEFYGSWSVYPYYTSAVNKNTAALTSIEKGLFIVSFNRDLHA